ncbi:MAG: sigma-54 dependent transcriptional regulator [Bryobacteraceae bacterium]
MHTILVAEDEPEVRNYLGLALSCQGYNVEFAQNGEEVMSYLSTPGQSDISLLLLDIVMPCKDGLETLSDIRRICPDMPVIMLSGAPSPANIVAAMKNGARDFIPKPVSHDDLRGAIERALPMTSPRLGGSRSPLAVTDEDCAPASGAWTRKIELLIQTVGSSDVPVLLLGETGVGKEVLARRLHARSPRAGRPFLKLNCAALPSELVESELFGYERGAFTGAFKNTRGKFEMANGGTILLDEIGDMDFKLQAKLLQVLQDREFMRLGAKETSKVDVRVMAATHCDLEKAIAEGRFREDLYYRLNIIDVHIPALRHRLDEVIPLAEYFLTKHGTIGAPPPELSSSLKRALLEHDWPGNIRELENVMRRFLVVRDAELLVTELHRKMRRRHPGIATRPVFAPVPPERESVNPRRSEPETEDGGEITVFGEAASVHPAAEAYPVNTPESTPVYQAPVSGSLPVSILEKVDSARKAAEAEAILSALNSTLWNRKQAAVLLNIDYKALLYKMKKLGIGARPGEPDAAEPHVAAAKA